MSASILVPGNWVKIERSRERFWCQIMERASSEAGCVGLKVRVDNYLLCNPSLRMGDTLVIAAEDVVDVLTSEDCKRWIAALWAGGSARGSRKPGIQGGGVMWLAARRGRDQEPQWRLAGGSQKML